MNKELIKMEDIKLDVDCNNSGRCCHIGDERPCINGKDICPYFMAWIVKS
jgi:hypothetical protein